MHAATRQAAAFCRQSTSRYSVAAYWSLFSWRLLVRIPPVTRWPAPCARQLPCMCASCLSQAEGSHVQDLLQVRGTGTVRWNSSVQRGRCVSRRVRCSEEEPREALGQASGLANVAGGAEEVLPGDAGRAADVGGAVTQPGRCGNDGGRGGGARSTAARPHWLVDAAAAAAHAPAQHSVRRHLAGCATAHRDRSPV